MLIESFFGFRVFNLFERSTSSFFLGDKEARKSFKSVRFVVFIACSQIICYERREAIQRRGHGNE